MTYLNKMYGRILQRFKLPFIYYPSFPKIVDHSDLIAQASQYFKISFDKTKNYFDTYLQFHLSKEYEKNLGELKTLSFEEAFLIYVAVLLTKPSHVVEIGTQFGKSTRRIKDILNLVGKNSDFTCFDLVDKLEYVDHEEVHLVLHDLTNDFEKAVLTNLNPGVIFIDAHPYYLLRNIISKFLVWSKSNKSIMVIHDCGMGLYNPRMKLSKEDIDAITSKTGVWERHVLSDIFSVQIDLLDDLRTSTHHLKICNTPHGLALLSPNSLFVP